MAENINDIYKRFIYKYVNEPHYVPGIDVVKLIVAFEQGKDIELRSTYRQVAQPLLRSIINQFPTEVRNIKTVVLGMNPLVGTGHVNETQEVKEDNKKMAARVRKQREISKGKSEQIKELREKIQAVETASVQRNQQKEKIQIALKEAGETKDLPKTKKKKKKKKKKLFKNENDTRKARRFLILIATQLNIIINVMNNFTEGKQTTNPMEIAQMYNTVVAALEKIRGSFKMGLDLPIKYGKGEDDWIGLYDFSFKQPVLNSRRIEARPSWLPVLNSSRIEARPSWLPVLNNKKLNGITEIHPIFSASRNLLEKAGKGEYAKGRLRQVFLFNMNEKYKFKDMLRFVNLLMQLINENVEKGKNGGRRKTRKKKRQRKTRKRKKRKKRKTRK